jgi:hypothetical protein
MVKTGSDKLRDMFDKLTDEQKAALSGMDSATAAQSRTRDNQIKTAQNLQDFVKMGVAPATQALSYFTEAVEYLTSFIPGYESKKQKEMRAAAAKATTASATGQVPGAAGTMEGFEVPTAGVAEGPAAPAGAPGGKGTTGLKLKSGAEKMGASTDTLYAMAQKVHEMLGGNYKYFSGLKDRGIDAGGAHPQGRAFDLVLNDPAQYADVVSRMRAMGSFSQVLDESQAPANPAQRDKWAPHIHAEVAAANGAILSGPMSGYRPNLTMHGTEAVVPLNTPAQQAAAGMPDNTLMSAQLDKLDEMVSILKNQLSVSTKIMQYST